MCLFSLLIEGAPVLTFTLFQVPTPLHHCSWFFYFLFFDLFFLFFFLRVLIQFSKVYLHLRSLMIPVTSLQPQMLEDRADVGVWLSSGVPAEVNRGTCYFVKVLLDRDARHFSVIASWGVLDGPTLPRFSVSKPEPTDHHEGSAVNRCRHHFNIYPHLWVFVPKRSHDTLSNGLPVVWAHF